MPARVTSDTFIGRRAELAELGAALARAREGRAGLVFVAGESGVGKSRLVGHFTRRAEADGAHVLWGDCVELGASELPYGAIVSALRPLARQGHRVLDELGPARAELAHLLPELGEVGDLRVEPFSGNGQGRLFELLLAVLDRLSHEAPLVLVLDDLHWADRSTRDFIAFLARNLCGSRLLLVATFRVDELHRRHPLRPFLADVERTELAQRLPVERFTREELADQLAAILGAPPDRDLLDRLWARSEGNPLFAEELLAVEQEGCCAEMPESLRDALMLRVEALGGVTQEALRWVAAAQRVEHDVLAEVSGVEPRELRDALREAVAHHVLVGHDDGTFAFRHALLREAVEDDLLPGEHAELHLGLARALEARLGQDSCGRVERATAVAHHYDVAGAQPEALRASVRAAQGARQVLALSEAAALYERALQLWDRVEAGGGDPATLAGLDRIDLLAHAAYANDGNPARAVSLVRKALELVDRRAEPARAAMLLNRLGKASWALGKGGDGIAAWDEALALLPAEPPSRERAELLAAKAGALMLWGHLKDADALADEALAAADAVGSRWVEMHALNTKGVTRMAFGGIEESEAVLRRAMHMADEDDEPVQMSRAYMNLSDVLHLAGRTREAYELLLAGAERMSAFGHKAIWLHLQRAEMAYHLGLWDEADALMPPEMAPRHENMTLVFFETRRAELELARGQHDSARRRLERARSLVRRSFEPQWHSPITALLAGLERRERNVDAAREQIAIGLRRLHESNAVQDGARLARILTSAAGVEADAAQQARDLGRPQDEAEAVAASRAFARRAREAAELPSATAVPEAAAYALVAEADAAGAGGRPQAERWAQAATAWERIERPYRAARCRWRQADALLHDGRRADAEAVAADALAVARALGAAWLIDELVALARRGRLRLHDVPAATEAEPATPPAEDPAATLGLTPRERDVLALVARGRTNREIGEELFMAEKTASVHVSRILAKLDVRSRTEAAAVAHRLGLDHSDGVWVAAAG
ncbi:MAG TPA: AAA family ATPase [Baekduia sp.]|nr:AAA family ATPase [Baekduia sp.]